MGCSKLTTWAAQFAAGQSCKTTLSSDGWTSRLPLQSMKPKLLNLFMKKVTRGRVVPTMSANVRYWHFADIGLCAAHVRFRGVKRT